MPSDALAHVHLITCVGVDTEYGHLPHFLAHYRTLGIPPENFHVILNTSDDNSRNLQRATSLLEERGLAEPVVWIAPYTSDSMWAKRREVQQQAVPDHHWVISADIDEFHEYPTALSAFIAECDARAVNCVQGVFIDRVAPGGQLADVEEDTPIWETFPVEADVQCTVGQTGAHHDWYGTVKVMALKGSLLPSRGGHHPMNNDMPVRYLFARHLATFPHIGKAWFRFRVPLRVHHFKWTASMPATLRQRLATPGVSPAGAEYGQKLLDYFEANHGIRLNDIPIRRSGRSSNNRWRRRVAYLEMIDKRLRVIARTRYYVGRAKKRFTP